MGWMTDDFIFPSPREEHGSSGQGCRHDTGETLNPAEYTTIPEGSSELFWGMLIESLNADNGTHHAQTR